MISCELGTTCCQAVSLRELTVGDAEFSVPTLLSLQPQMCHSSWVHVLHCNVTVMNTQEARGKVAY